MKFNKDWKYIKIVLSILLVLLIIYKLNGDTNESFQNNNNNNDDNSQLTIKQEIASLLDIPEDRIENIHISGTEPNITVTFYVSPRDINDEESHTLETVHQNIKNMKENINYEFTIDGNMHTFTNISVATLDKSDTKTQQLKNKFIDPQIDEQIQHLKDVKNYIKNGTYIKYDNPMDRFYEFNKHGNLTVEAELQNPETTEPQTEAGVLDGDGE